MKNKMFLVLLTALVMSVSSYSQVKLGIAVEGGMNIANISVSPDVATSSRSGMIIGGGLDISFAKNFSVEPGLRFIMKGYQVSGNGVTSTIKLNYLDIPVMLKANFPLTEVKPYVMAGPVLGINLAATEEDVGNGQSQTSDVSSSVSSTDFGLLFGGGVEFKVAQKVSLFANFGYQIGLSNILKNSTTTTVKNIGFQITAGAMFHL